MAIFHFDAKIISRGKGQSAIAAAAYRSGDRLQDEQAGEQKFYAARADRILFKAIMAPPGAPEWAYDRNRLWNEAERAEKRKDAQLAREVEIALPHELTPQQREYLVKDFARETFVRKGYAVDIAIHAPDRDSDRRNYHAHIMVTRRTLEPEGFSATKDWKFDKTQLARWREQWAHLANRHLERYGHEARIDHRSLEEQGVDREATVHVGYAGLEIARRGGESDRMAALKDVLARNGERIELRHEMAAIEAELGELSRLQAQEQAKEALAGARALARATDEAERTMTPQDRLQRALEADERALRGDAEKAFGANARAEASHIRQESRAERDQARQRDWRERVEDRAHGQPQPVEQGLRVVDGATGIASRLGDFVASLLAGSPRPRPVDEREAMRAYSSDPAIRRQQRHARIAAERAAEAAARSIERVREDMEAGRDLKADDIRGLTRAQQEQIASLGDAAVRQMVADARKRDERHWRGEERERER